MLYKISRKLKINFPTSKTFERLLVFKGNSSSKIFLVFQNLGNFFLSCFLYRKMFLEIAIKICKMMHLTAYLVLYLLNTIMYNTELYASFITGFKTCLSIKL